MVLQADRRTLPPFRSARNVQPRVYEPPSRSGSPTRARPLPSGMDECSFQPQTNWRRYSARKAVEDSRWDAVRGEARGSACCTAADMMAWHAGTTP